MQPQRSFADVEYDGKKRQTRRERFLQRMDGLIPWQRLEQRLRPVYPTGGHGRPPYPLPVMLRIHCVQLFYNLSDPAMEDALYEIASIQRFVGVSVRGPLPDETTILNFRHLLERHGLGDDLLAEITQHLAAQGVRLREGTIVDATIIAAPASTKNRAQQRDPEMHQAKKGNQWYFGMKAHIGVDAHTGLVHSLATTAANVADVTQVPQLLHGSETRVWGDAGYQGVDRRPEHQGRGDGLAGGAAGRAAAPLATGQCGRAGGAAQSGDPGEGGASVPVREAPLRLRDGAVSGPGEEPQPALPVIWAGESVAGGALSDRVSGRPAPRRGARTAPPAGDRADRPRSPPQGADHCPVPAPGRSGTPVVQSFPRGQDRCPVAHAAGSAGAHLSAATRGGRPASTSRSGRGRRGVRSMVPGGPGCAQPGRYQRKPTHAARSAGPPDADRARGRAAEPADKPHFVAGGHLSGTGVAAGLVRPTWDLASSLRASLLGLAPGRG